MTTPPRRSELVCPGHSLKMMTKAAASAADEVIFDLEDACPPAKKVEARALVAQALETCQFTGNKVRAYRINAVGTPWWQEDLTIASRAQVVVVPKVRSADEVRAVAELLPEGVGLEVLIETAAGLLNAYSIAQVPGVVSLIFGVADFAADVGARDFRDDDFGYARAQLLVAARAAGVQAIDSVTVKFQDPTATANDAQRAARMGYDGKWAIHPSQLEPIHAAFNPTAGEIAAAQRVVKAYERAGHGAIELDGEMVDQATIAVAQKRLEVARRAGLIA
ncbi:MAG: CoA ester lyase [Myxococcaceae bacterium]|nr:CoA ester lyase [Myxococcaceae bacterium]